jgi:hypothetical protein
MLKKGDVLVWHAGLAHRGTPVRDRSLTRKAYVTRYSSLGGYPRDRRRSDRAPLAYEMNGGLVYEAPRWPEGQDCFRRGENP